jgi:hypothetical protein
MTDPEEKMFMLDLAIVQLIAGILVTIGSTLLAISIGFGLTIPEAMQDALLQTLIMKTELSPEMQQTILEESLSNYVFILAAVSASLILMGVLFASARTAGLRRQIKAGRKIAKLLAEDIQEKPVIKQSTRIEE